MKHYANTKGQIMRKFIIATVIAALAVVAGFAPAAAGAATTRSVKWGVTGYATVVHVGTVNWPRKLYGTRAAADAHLAQVKALQVQVCPLAPVACARFVESPVIVG